MQGQDTNTYKIKYMQPIFRYWLNNKDFNNPRENTTNSITVTSIKSKSF